MYNKKPENPKNKNRIWFDDLNESVIEKDICTKCGTCRLACPLDLIEIDSKTGKPKLQEECTGCSLCWNHCPRGGLQLEKLKENISKEKQKLRVYSTRAKSEKIREKAQDGGGVTGLLSELLSKNLIDGAVIATESANYPLKGETYIARSEKEIIENSGTFYNQTMQLGKLKEAIDKIDIEHPTLALVGTPCVIEGYKALEFSGLKKETDYIDFSLSLMCTKSFDYDKLHSILKEKEVNIEKISKINIDSGYMYIYDDKGEKLLKERIKEFEKASLKGCEECDDFTGETADISAGSIGTKGGYTTIIVRTKKGRKIWEKAQNALETKSIKSKNKILQ